jgi:hypothetical protein
MLYSRKYFENYIFKIIIILYLFTKKFDPQFERSMGEGSDIYVEVFNSKTKQKNHFFLKFVCMFLTTSGADIRAILHT